MKQMKFFLVALMAVVMGMSVTSCMNGDDNTARQLFTIAKCTSTYPATFQTPAGQKLVINDASLITLNTGELYNFWYEYDSAEQPDNSETLYVTLYGGSTPVSINAKYTEGPTNASESSKANAPLYAFNLASDYSTQPGVLFDQQYLVIPVVYCVKVENSSEEQNKELEKHSFILTYDEETIESGATELVLTLNHVINTEGEAENVSRNRYTSAYKAYRLDYAMSAFRNKAGQNPTKITVKAKVNSSENTLDGATDATPWEYTVK